MKHKTLFFGILILILAGLAWMCVNYLNLNMTKRISIQNVKNKENIIENNQEEEAINSISNGENTEGSPNNQQNPDLQIENTKKKTDSKEIEEKSDQSSTISKKISWGFASVPGERKIDTIIIHSSYDALGSDPYSIEGLLKEYRVYGVAPHYLIDRDGKVYQLVADQDVAYHAGVSRISDGRENVNNFSLGIELMNKEDGKYTGKQYVGLKKLVDNLKKKYPIKYVLGHNQISSGRKTDPWNFDWNELK